MRASLLLALMLSACTGGPKPTPSDDGEETGLSGGQLQVSVASVDFGDVGYGDLKSASVNVSNPGDALLTIATITVAAPFQVSPAFLELQPGATSTITLYVQPVDYGTFTSDLTLETDSAHGQREPR